MIVAAKLTLAEARAIAVSGNRILIVLRSGKGDSVEVILDLAEARAFSATMAGALNDAERYARLTAQQAEDPA